jgi:hypothetical protein
MQFITTDICDQRESSFFMIPREMRDEVYHQLFSSDRCLFHAYMLPSSDLITSSEYYPEPAYRFDLRYSQHDLASRVHGFNGNSPTWLLTCKATYHEGRAQYFRRAEWVWQAYFTRIFSAGHRDWKTELSATNLTRLEMQVSNLANYETPHRGEGSDTRNALANTAKSLREGKVRLERVRFVGHSYRLAERPHEPHCGYQVEHMMHNLMGHFEGIQVKKWELGIVGRPSDWMWVLYEWVQNGAGDPLIGKLRLLVDDRVAPPTNKDIGREWIRQELVKAKDEELERKKIRTDRIREELSRKAGEDAAN